MSTAPAALAAQQIQILLSHLSGVRDGLPEDVHQARVSSRRLRELLPLAAGDTTQPFKQMRELVRDTGRALGVVRELDTLMSLCDRLAHVYPTGAAALAACRAELRGERERAVRRLVKRLDRLEVASLAEAVPPRRFTLWPQTAWKAALTERLAARAVKLDRAIDRASGVYFPNRLHRLRIHLKKLRYGVEIAEQSNLWHPAHLRRDAGRLQDILGEMHDRQVLLDRIGFAESDPGLRATIRADIASRHADYLARRDRLHAMVAACKRFAQGSPHWGARHVAGTAAALLIPAGAALIGRDVNPAQPDRAHVA